MRAGRVGGDGVVDAVRDRDFDLVYLPGNLWFSMNAVYAFTAIVTMIMTTVAVVGIIYRTDRRSRFYLSWVGIAIIGLYLLGMYVIYRA